jgi:hypothetical protein
MTTCDNAFAVRNISTEDVYLPFPGIAVLHPGQTADLIALGIELQAIASSADLLSQFARGRLLQVTVSGKNNVQITSIQNTNAAPTQLDTEQLVLGCDLAGSPGPFTPAGGGGGGSLTKVTASVGDGATTLFNVTHNLGTLDVMCQAYANSAPKQNVEPRFDRISTTQVQVRFDVAPTTNQYTIIIIG